MRTKDLLFPYASCQKKKKNVSSLNVFSPWQCQQKTAKKFVSYFLVTKALGGQFREHHIIYIGANTFISCARHSLNLFCLCARLPKCIHIFPQKMDCPHLTTKTIPHRTYIEMKKLSGFLKRKLVFNVSFCLIDVAKLGVFNLSSKLF